MFAADLPSDPTAYSGPDRQTSQSGPGFEVGIDHQLGGRWTSLRDRRGLEWLWSRDEPRRASAQVGDPFIDAGGVEECFPTIVGTPDHGDFWTRPWTIHGQGWKVASGPFELCRRVRVGESIVVDYELTGPPQARFIWAFHALIEPTEGLRIDAFPGRCRAWPGDDASPVETEWPTVLGDPRFDVLGPDDGSALFTLLPGQEEVAIHRGSAGLRFRLFCPGQPTAIGIWRNLGGHPSPESNFRSLGIEPMLGYTPALGNAHEGEAATIPGTGKLNWQLSIDDGPRRDAARQRSHREDRSAGPR